MAELATTYDQKEVQFFKALVRTNNILTLKSDHSQFLQVEQIMLARNEAYCIRSIPAHKLGTGMTRVHAQNVLKNFVHESWLTPVYAFIALHREY